MTRFENLKIFMRSFCKNKKDVFKICGYIFYIIGMVLIVLGAFVFRTEYYDSFYNKNYSQINFAFYIPGIFVTFFSIMISILVIIQDGKPKKKSARIKGIILLVISLLLIILSVTIFRFFDYERSLFATDEKFIHINFTILIPNIIIAVISILIFLASFADIKDEASIIERLNKSHLENKDAIEAQRARNLAQIAGQRITKRKINCEYCGLKNSPENNRCDGCGGSLK